MLLNEWFVSDASGLLDLTRAVTISKEGCAVGKLVEESLKNMVLV